MPVEEKGLNFNTGPMERECKITLRLHRGIGVLFPLKIKILKKNENVHALDISLTIKCHNS